MNSILKTKEELRRHGFINIEIMLQQPNKPQDINVYPCQALIKKECIEYLKSIDFGD